MCSGKSWRKPFSLRKIRSAGIVIGWAIANALQAPAAETRPAPPADVKAIQQDAQAARVQWAYAGNGLGYVLYAAYDEEHPVFHRENEEPLHQNYIVWDAPRRRGRRFVFYVTAMDQNGHESAPSKKVTVDLSHRASR